jgi:hypothetical protein
MSISRYLLKMRKLERRRKRSEAGGVGRVWVKLQKQGDRRQEASRRVSKEKGSCCKCKR